jgi:tellurite methyltransferase
LRDREKWNERYAAEDLTIQQPDDIVARAASFITPGRALDIACGTGRNALFLARSGWSVLGVDISEAALYRLRATASLEVLAVDTVQMDLTSSAPFPPNSFDLICDCRYLQRDLFPVMRSALRTRGILVALIAMEEDDLAVKPMNNAYLLRHHELRGFAAGLEVLEYEETKLGPGKRKLAQMIARRPPGDV